MIGHHKTLRRFHEPGDLHELTFSCYRRMPLLTNDVWREQLCRSIDKAITRWNFRLVAFVLMPEHVHLLVYPTTTIVEIDNLLSAINSRPSNSHTRSRSRTNSWLAAVIW